MAEVGKKPKESKVYYYISEDGQVHWSIWRNGVRDNALYHIGNVFNTMAGAERAAEVYRKIMPIVLRIIKSRKEVD